MKEYIEKADAINLLWLFADESCASVVSDFEGLPAADVAPVRHGKWKPVKYNAYCSCGKSYGTYHFLCSACNHIAYSQPYRLTYCPNCGARMDEEADLNEAIEKYLKIKEGAQFVGIFKSL